MTRRGVLTGAAAIAGVSALGVPLARPAAIAHVVVDQRLRESAAFAGGVRGSRIHPINALDDLCHHWYTGLRREVLAGGGSIAGLTTWMDYVVMRSAAAEVGYRGVFHAEHLPLEPMRLEHRVTAHPDLLTSLMGLAPPQSWAQALGRSLASGAHLRSRVLPGEVFSAALAAEAPGHFRMVTWVFSPAS